MEAQSRSGYRSVGKKLEIVPEEAALVRKIFENYLRLGSIGELAAALEREGVRPKPRVLASGATIAAPRYMVGPLAHILKNRSYIGDRSVGVRLRAAFANPCPARA